MEPVLGHFLHKKKEALLTSIRRQARQQTLTHRRQLFLSQITLSPDPCTHLPTDNSNLNESYVKIAQALIKNDASTFNLIPHLISHSSELLQAVSVCTFCSWSYFCLILETITSHVEIPATLNTLALCLDLLVLKFQDYIDSHRQHYNDLVEVLFGLVEGSLSLLVQRVNDVTVKVLERVLNGFIKEFDEEWQPEYHIGTLFRLLNIVVTLDDKIEDIKQITEEAIILKRRKYKLINRVVYGQNPLWEHIRHYLLDSNSQQTKKEILKFLVNLTCWIQNKEFIQPIIEIDLLAVLLSVLQLQQTKPVFTRVGKVLHNLLILDRRIAEMASDRNVITIVLDLLKQRPFLLDKDVYLQAVGNYVMYVDMGRPGVEEELAVAIESLIENLKLDLTLETQLIVLGALRYLQENSPSSTEKVDLKIIEFIFNNSNNHQLKCLSEAILRSKPQLEYFSS